MKTTYALAGTACLAAIAVTLMNSSALTGLKDSMIGHQAPEEISAPAQSDARIAAPAAEMSATPPAPVEPKAAIAQRKEDASARQMQSEKTKADTALPSVPMNAQKPAMYGAAPAASSLAKVAGNAAPEPLPAFNAHEEGRDRFTEIHSNPLKIAQEDPVSTFSIDVDTSSYSFVRASLNNGALPQKDAVRVEEMVNYFPYDYATPKDKAQPFATQVAVFPTPWNKHTRLLHIGIKGYELPTAAKPHANLVFLVDTSGSMNEPNKLPLLVHSLKLLLENLKPEDTISLVTYAGSAGVVLEPTPAKEKAKIAQALGRLQAGGSTAGAEGIRTAYDLAEAHFDKQGVNRVILATDGDFNVGITSEAELKGYIERKRDTGIFLSVLGFGNGNYNDAMMQTLAQNGNGNAAYIDTLNEARKVLVEEAGSTLFPIAKDVKIQVEFNPATVSEYRLIGYETRLLNREDFNNDKVDAGEIGAGHAVTAIYEITPTGSKGQVDDLRYGQPASPKADKGSDEYAFVRIRYKLPEGRKSTLLTTPVDRKADYAAWEKAPQESRFAATVAAFGQLLRGDASVHDFTYDDVLNLAQGAKGEDPFGYRAEFLQLVRLAKSQTPRAAE